MIDSDILVSEQVYKKFKLKHIALSFCDKVGITYFDHMRYIRVQINLSFKEV